MNRIELQLLWVVEAQVRPIEPSVTKYRYAFAPTAVKACDVIEKQLERDGYEVLVVNAVKASGNDCAWKLNGR